MPLNTNYLKILRNLNIPQEIRKLAFLSNVLIPAQTVDFKASNVAIL
jgi:hypothetical protein